MGRSNKILICIPSYTFGGAETHSLYTAKAIQKNTDYEVYFLAFGRIDTFKSKLEEEGFKVLHFNLNNFLSLNSFKKCIQLFKLFFFLRPFKFKYIFSGTEQCNLLMGLTWKFLRVKKFYWHQWGVNNSINTGFWEKLVAKTNPTYIANSEACKENLLIRHSILNKEKVTIIQNTFNEEIIKYDFNKTDDSFRIVMVANFFEEKDHLTVLEALKLFVSKFPDSNIKIVFAGRSNGSNLLLHAKSKAFDYGLHSYVEFAGLIENIGSFLSTFDIGLLSTKSEGFSNALLEYMAAGLPVIASDISQNREALEKGNKFFSVGNSIECCENFELFYLNRNLMKEIGEKNKKYVQASFSNEIYEKKIKELL